MKNEQIAANDRQNELLKLANKIETLNRPLKDPEDLN